MGTVVFPGRRRSRSSWSPTPGSAPGAGSSSGSAAAPTDDEIAEETERLVQRDARDATQTVQARDAVLIDTTYLTQAEQVERIVAAGASAVSSARPDAGCRR